MKNLSYSLVATGLGFPEAPVSLGRAGILLTELATGCVTIIAPDGQIERIATGGSPNGAAIGADGAVYIANNGGAEYRPGHFLPVGVGADYVGGSIQRLDLKTRELRTLYTHCGGNRLSAPNDLVFDKSGGFYFTDTGKRYARSRDHGGLYYALADGSSIREVAYPILTPNGVGLSPDEATLYVADMEPARLWAFDLVEPGVIRREAFPSPYGGRLVAGLGGFQRFDSLKVAASGNICVATLVAGTISVIAPDGSLHSQVETPDQFPTNICFAGDDMQTAYVTLARSGHLIRFDWFEPGLKLNFQDM
jgi:gluconolactonase